MKKSAQTYFFLSRGLDIWTQILSHLTSNLVPGRGIWPSVISKVQMPGGSPGRYWSFELIDTLLEADVGPFEILNVRWVLALCLKSEVTLKVYFKHMVAMAIMKVFFCPSFIAVAVLIAQLIIPNNHQQASFYRGSSAGVTAALVFQGERWNRFHL